MGQNLYYWCISKFVVIENNGLKAQTMRKALEAVNFYRDDIIKVWKETFDKE